MKRFFLLVIFSGLISVATAQDCANCEKLVCDGVNCDDGSPADGVQTARNCSCGQEIQGACAYVEIDLGLNPYYDPNDTNCKLIFRTQESGNFSIYYLDDVSCTVTDCQAPSFVVGSENTIENIPSDGILRMYICKNGGNAGRRDFTFSISCPTIENCVNLVDDDNDLWIDCEDGDCNTDAYCTYSETSSSSDGGLESNSRLSQKIARRNFIRAQFDIDRSRRENQRRFFKDNLSVARKNQTFQLNDAIPEKPLTGSVSRVSSPDDLMDITNAVEVFSTDIYVDESRKGSILATRSANGVYEHTKYICDRLNGARIDKVVKMTVNNFSFLVTKFARSGGITEYNTNFSFFVKQDKDIQWESHWNLSDYSQGEDFYNYQLWANNLTNLQAIIEGILLNIQSYWHISTRVVGDPPPVLVNSVWYENQQLYLKISNPNALEALNISGVLMRTEQDEEEPFSYIQKVDSDTIVVEMGSAFALGVTLTDPNTNGSDAIYFADGSWGLDFKPGEAFVKKFDISASDFQFVDDIHHMRPIERNISLEASVKSSLALYRAMNASYETEDVSDYKYFNFKAQGNNEVIEVVFVKAGISEWNDQPRSFIRLSETETTHSVDLSDLSAQLDDLRMMVFKYTNPTSDNQEISMNVREAAFSNETMIDIFEKQITVAPNPIKDRTYITISSDIDVKYALTLTNLRGQVAYSKTGYVFSGLSSISLSKPANLKNGIYILELKTANGESYTRKVVFE